MERLSITQKDLEGLYLNLGVALMYDQIREVFQEKNIQKDE